MVNTFLTFLLALFFLLLGLMALLIPFSANVRTETVDFLLSSGPVLYVFSSIFLALAIGLLAQLYHNRKRKYITLEHKGLTLDISQEVIQESLSAYFKELFPLSEVPIRLLLKKHKAKVTVDLPYTPPELQIGLLKKIESDLVELFRDPLGYRNELTFSFSFSEKP